MHRALLLAAAPAHGVSVPATQARHCLDKYWAGQTADQTGCLSQTIVCVDVIVSGQTVAAASLNVVITDQDFYNVIHNGIAQGGGTFNGFSIDFATVSAIPAADVSAVDNFLTDARIKFVTSELQDLPPTVCNLFDGPDCAQGPIATTHLNTVPKPSP